MVIETVLAGWLLLGSFFAKKMVVFATESHGITWKDWSPSAVRDIFATDAH